MYDQEAWFDRTHNVILDWLISAGILGLLAYLFMYAATLWYIWKNRQGTTGLSFAQKSTLTGLLAAYFIHNLFVFDNIPSYIIFFSIIAFVHCLAAKKPLIAGPVEDIHKPVFSDPVIVNYIGVPVIGVVLVVGLYFTNIPGLRANTTLIDAMSLCNTGRYAEAKIAFKMALAENQYVGIQQTREQVMTCAGRVFSDTDVSRSTSSLKQEWFTYAVETLDEQTKLTPNDIRGLYFAGVFFNALKQWSSGAPYLEQALQIAPAKQIIQVQLGANYLNTPGKEADALKLFTIAYKTAPKMESAAIGYAQALVINGKYPEAVKEFGATSSVMTSDDLIAVHLKLKSFDLLIAAANARIKANSNDIQALFYRGVAQYKLGREYAALADLDTISKKLPDNVQIKEIIKQIQAGKDPFTSLFASSEK
jgi:tetratricopeptide (TPR) repeat protein